MPLPEETADLRRGQESVLSHTCCMIDRPGSRQIPPSHPAISNEALKQDE